MKLRDSIAIRQLTAFAAVVAVFAAATCFSIARLSDFYSAVGQVTGPQLHNLEIAQRWLDSVEQSARLVGSALILSDDYEVPEQIGAIRHADTQAMLQSQTLNSSSDAPEEIAAVQNVLSARSVYAPLETEILTRMQAGQARTALLKQAQGLQLRYAAALQHLREVEEERMIASSTHLAATYATTRWLLTLLFMAAVAISALLGYRNARAVQRPLQRIIRHFEEIRTGKLNGPIAVNVGGEMGEVLVSLQATQQVLRDAATMAADRRRK